MSLPVSGVDPTRVVGRRFLAWLLDSLIDVGIIIGLLQLLGIDLERQRTTGTVFDAQVDADGSTALAFLLVWLVWFVARVVLVGKLGWTPGKLALGIRVARWDGRPPGIPRALGRSLFFGVGQGIGGCLYWLVALFTMTTTRGHRQPADYVAGTWVIDGWYAGHMIIEGADGVTAGPPPLERDEAQRYLEDQGMPAAQAAAVVAPGPRTTEPFFDKARDTHVVWHPKRNEWLQFDRRSEGWVPLRDPGHVETPDQGAGS
jgi:uncharacterized RDD family membrane protein YckC